MAMTATQKAAAKEKRAARKAEAEAAAKQAAKDAAAEFEANCLDPSHPLYDDPVWNPHHELYGPVSALINAGMLGGDAVAEVTAHREEALATHEAARKAADKEAAEVEELAEWLAEQTWSEFAVSLATQYKTRRSLSPKQIAAGRSMRQKTEAKRAAKKAATPDTGLDLSALPSGYYADPAEGTRLKLRISRGKEGGSWAGVIFVADDAAYGARRNYGMQRPGQAYKGQVADVLARVLEAPLASMKAYGKLVGRCGACGRRLEDADSIAAGIGPICAQKFEG